MWYDSSNELIGTDTLTDIQTSVDATSSSGTTVTYTVTATDAVDGNITNINYSHNSGDEFEIGTTTVTGTPCW